MKAFKGIKSGSSRSADRLEVTTDGPAVIVGVISPEFRADAAMAVTPATARKIAAELIRAADEADAHAAP